MKVNSENKVIDFYRYPPIGVDDWRYMFATAKVRVLETQMLSKPMFADMANAGSFEEAVDLLGSSEYAAASGAKSFAEIEQMLIERRSEARALFAELMVEEEFVEILRAREDFANMRLAIRRVVTERPVGLDYSDEGSVRAEEFEEIFNQENYDRFPEYLQEAVEAAVLGYYQDKHICRIDHGIDREFFGYKLRRAYEMKSEFLESLFRTQIDLTNIRTMLRLKMAEREDRDMFFDGGFLSADRLIQGLGSGYESLGALFFATPYHEVVDGGTSYLVREQSFLGLEQLCAEHLMGFLKMTGTITAGPQPVIAYFLMKENEIRTVRMVLTAKKNGLETKLILDRLGAN